MSGTIAVTVTVAPDGSVADAAAEKGNPILVKAALAAARQWRFTPYPAQAGEPMRTASINFRFDDQQ
jgi:TonB family protein